MVGIRKIIIPTYIIIFLFATFGTAIAQQYCIDQSEFNRWLCNNIRGAQQACSAPNYVGEFPDYNSCDIERRNALPDDFRWQQMTKCVPCGSSTQPDRSHIDKERTDQRNEEEERLIDEVKGEAIKEDTARKEYLNNIRKEMEQKSNEIKSMKDIAQQMKISAAPISSYQKEHYRKTLEQIYCIAYISIQAAELALRGNFEISKNLLTDIESVREVGGAGFDDKINAKFLSSCPKNITFQIPEVYISIEKDPQYIKYNEIIKTVRTLIPEIQNIGNELELVKIKKEKTQKELKKIDQEIKEIEAKKQAVNTSEKKEDIDDLLAKALALKQQAEAEYKEAIQNEQKFMQEKQNIEKEIGELKRKMFGEEKK